MNVPYLKSLQSGLEQKAVELREELLKLEGEFRGLQKLIDVPEPTPEPKAPVKVDVTQEQPADGEPTPAD